MMPAKESSTADLSGDLSLDAIEGGDRATKSEIHDALADERRREILSVLVERALPAHTTDIAQAVAAREAGTSVEAVTTEHVATVNRLLYHHQLPKLADAGLVEYDAERGVVEDVADGVEEIVE
jgi:DNA-binding transcriptional ArsR family regulator